MTGDKSTTTDQRTDESDDASTAAGASTGDANTADESTAAGTSTGDANTADAGGFSRRTVLGSVLAGGAAAAGFSVATDRRDPGPVREDHEWTPAEPPLETPWFGDVSPDAPLTEYPRPQLVRDRWQHLNGVWGFEPASAAESPPTDRQLDEGILVPFPVESALSGVAREESRMWYRRTFEIPDGWDVRGDERLLLHFEAVDYETTVFVNGERVGGHTGGYDHFALDVTDAVSEARRQELVVGVVDRTEEGQTLGKQHPNTDEIWYTPTSGIWQSVWLEPVPETHVTGLDATPDLSGERLALTVEAAAAGELRVEATATAEGDVVATATGAPGEELALSLPDPRTWSPTDPFLYDLDVRLLRNGEAVDAVESYFGMRSVGTERVNDRTRMTLNGEASFALATLDQGFWPGGIYTAPTDEALAFDLETHRELGFNAVRKHVKVEPRRWYFHADRLGLVVHQDMPSTADFSGTPDADRREQFETELRVMIEQLGNHPSITAWVPFNEGWGSYDTERIAAAVEEWDPHRLVNPNSGANVDGGDCGCGDVLDFHNYPGPGSAPPADERVSVLGEFGGLGLAVDGHEWGSDGFAYDTYVTPAGLTDAYVRKLERVQLLASQCGLGSAVYTQLTDVENENNGLLTYDRRVVKPDADRVRAVNEALIEAATALESDSADRSGDLTGVAHWPLDENATDGDAVADAVGDADAQAVGDPTPVEGRVDGALAFDGSYAETGAGILDTVGDYSVAAWVRLSERSGTQTAVSQDGESVSAFALQYDGEVDRFRFVATDRDATADPSKAAADDAPETGRWYHLVGVRDVADGAIRLYVDGERADETTFCPGFAAEGPTVIGRGRWDGISTAYWRGAVDEVRAFDWALGDDDATRLYEREA